MEDGLFRRSAALAVAVLLLAGVTAGPPATAADELVTVSGTVTGAPGDDDFWLTFSSLGGADTVPYERYVDATPDFTAQLPPGRYPVYISTEESASGFLGGSRFAAGSEVLVVPDAGLTRNITLSAAAGTISGTVAGFPAGVSHLITVQAFAYNPTTHQSGGGTYIATPIGPGADGTFTLRGLAPGVYILRGYSEPDISGFERYFPERKVVRVTAGANTDVGALTFGYVPLTYTRVAGADRYQTAAALSSKYYRAAATDTVFIASGAEFPDALSAAPAAAANRAPVLLVPRSGIPAAVAAELKRIGPSTIYVIGGTGAVSSGTQAALRAYAGTVERISGADRYATSRAIAERFFSDPAVAYFATGRNFPDALAAGAVAGALGGPLVLVDGTRTSLDPATRSLVSSYSASLRIAGDTSVVSAGIEADLISFDPNLTRRSGADRYGTATSLASELSAAADTRFYAIGSSFADAAAASAVAGMMKSPLLLVGRSCDPNYHSLGFTYDQGPRTVVIAGGTGAVPPSSLRNC